MSLWVKVQNGVVIQVQPYQEEGFIVAPDETLPGWLYENGEFSAPPPPEITPAAFVLPIAILWLRMTDEEAEDFDGSMAVATPLRLRRAFNTATSLHSEGELFGFVKGVLSASLNSTRADEIMAEPDGQTSARLDTE